MRQIGDESRCDRVVSVQEDDGNFSGRGLGRANAVVLEGDDQIDSLACEGSIDGQCLRFVGEVAEIEAQVFAVRIAEFIEGGSQRLERWRYMVETDVACTDPPSLIRASRRGDSRRHQRHDGQCQCYDCAMATRSHVGLP